MHNDEGDPSREPFLGPGGISILDEGSCFDAMARIEGGYVVLVGKSLHRGEYIQSVESGVKIILLLVCYQEQEARCCRRVKHYCHLHSDVLYA